MPSPSVSDQMPDAPSGDTGGAGMRGQAAARSPGATRLLALLFGLLLGSEPALAQSPTRSCIEAHADSQALRRDAHLLAARQKLVQCAQEACPGLIRTECGTMLVQLDAALPTVVFELRGDPGDPRSSLRLLVDGEVATEALAGRALPLDPGEHRLRLERPPASPVEQTVLVIEGEHARKVVLNLPVLLPPPPPPPPPDTSAPGANGSADLLTGAYVAGGVTLVSLAATGIFWALHSGEFNRLHDSCGKTGSCKDSDEVILHRDGTLAAVSLGVGIVSLGTTIALYLLHDRAHSKSALLPGFAVQRSASATTLSWGTPFLFH